MASPVLKPTLSEPLEPEAREAQSKVPEHKIASPSSQVLHSSPEAALPAGGSPGEWHGLPCVETHTLNL